MRSATDWDLGMLLGRLLSSSDSVLARLQKIEARLDLKRARLDEVSRAMQAIEARLARIEAQPKASEPPPWERWAKDLLRYLLPLGALWATGSIDAAVKLVGAMK